MTIAKDAATILVVRDGEEALEVFMLRRSPRSDFVPGVYVFPGGGVEEADRAPDLASRCRGLTDSEASVRLGMPSGGLAVWVAAARECFEEAGILLGLDPGTVAADELSRLRRALNSGELGFADICREVDLTLPADAIHYYSHWITPEAAPIRYDTRFFVTAVPPDQVAFHDGVETVDHAWVTPARALDDHAAGLFGLVPATKRQLESMLAYESAADFVAAAGAASDVPTILPVIVTGDDGVPAFVRFPFPDGAVELPLSSI